MYKIYSFYKEPGENDYVRLVSEVSSKEIAYKTMLSLFTATNGSNEQYYCFGDNVFNADIIRINLWRHINKHKEVPSYVLYTVYAYNKTSKTLEVYPMHVFSTYDEAVKEALDFGSMLNDWIFVVATNRNQALKECAYYHANQARAKELMSTSPDADVFESLRTETDTNLIYKPLKLAESDLKTDNESANLVETEEKCYYSDGMLYMREIREYYKTDDMEEK